MRISWRPLVRARGMLGGVLAVSAALVICAQPGEPVAPAPGWPPGPVHAGVRLVGAPATSSAMGAAEHDFTTQVFRMVNRRRHLHGLQRVRLNGCVTGFSDHWAAHLVGENLYQHSHLRRLLHRCASPYVEENIAKLSDGATPRLLVRLWMHSPEHRANILNQQVTAGGLSVRWDPDRQVWIAVENFADRPGSLSGG